MAKYEACINELQAALDLKIKDLEIYRDLILIISQVSRKWKIKSLKLAKWHKCLMNLKDKFRSVSFLHVSRSRNHLADHLASRLKIFDNAPLRSIRVETRDDLARCMNVEEELDGRPWYCDVKKFLQRGVYPACATMVDKKTIRRLACQFFLDGDVLYEKAYDNVLLRCLDTKEANEIMWSTYEWSHVSMQDTTDGILFGPL